MPALTKDVAPQDEHLMTVLTRLSTLISTAVFITLPPPRVDQIDQHMLDIEDWSLLLP